METKYKLDIFQMLNSIDRKNDQVFSSLTEEEQKAFQPLVAMRWLSGIKSERQIVFLNEFVNPYIFSLYTHKNLLFKLMTVCTSGTINRYRWNKMNSKKRGNKPLSVTVIKEYFNYTNIQAIEALSFLSADDILQYATELGWQKDEISKLKQELKPKTENE